jgi:hypothetical protein
VQFSGISRAIFNFVVGLFLFIFWAPRLVFASDRSGFYRTKNDAMLLAADEMLLLLKPIAVTSIL